jgi:hypothetical protein
MVNEVSVEINVILVGSAQMREPPGVDRMDQNQA